MVNASTAKAKETQQKAKKAKKAKKTKAKAALQAKTSVSKNRTAVDVGVQNGKDELRVSSKNGADLGEWAGWSSTAAAEAVPATADPIATDDIPEESLDNELSRQLAILGGMGHTTATPIPVASFGGFSESDGEGDNVADHGSSAQRSAARRAAPRAADLRYDAKRFSKPTPANAADSSSDDDDDDDSLNDVKPTKTVRVKAVAPKRASSADKKPESVPAPAIEVSATESADEKRLRLKEEKRERMSKKRAAKKKEATDGPVVTPLDQSKFVVNTSFNDSLKHMDGTIPKIGTVTSFSFFGGGSDSDGDGEERGTAAPDTVASGAATASGGGFSFFGQTGLIADVEKEAAAIAKAVATKPVAAGGGGKRQRLFPKKRQRRAESMVIERPESSDDDSGGGDKTAPFCRSGSMDEVESKWMDSRRELTDDYRKRHKHAKRRRQGRT
jgi:hypothetical protein